MLTPQDSSHPKKLIKPYIRQQLVIPDPIDFEKHKRIKRTMALVEKHGFKKTFMDEKALSSSRFYSKKQAKELSIGFNMYKNNLKTVDRFLKRQPNLQRLSLCFSHRLNDEGWVKVGKILARFSRLTRIHIHFERAAQKIKNEVLLKLCKHLEELRKINDIVVSCGLEQPLILTLSLLRLGFSFNSGIISASNRSMMNRFIINEARQLRRLTTIRLDAIMNSTLTDNALEGFGKKLQNIQNLRKVDFNFQKCISLSPRGINLLLTHLAKISSLRIIKFKVYMKHSAVDFPLNHPIWTLKHIKRVDLDIVMPSISSVDTMMFTTNAISNISSLHSLSLNLTDCREVNDPVVESVGSILPKLSRLKKLRLNFTECQKVSDLGIASLFTSLLGLQKLEQLYLNFTSCCTVPVSNITISSEKTITGLSKLKKSNIYFSRCVSLSENLVNEVIDILSRCKRLEEIFVGLNGCETIHNKTLRCMGKALRRLENLTSLKLEFGNERGSAKNLFRRNNIKNGGSGSIKELLEGDLNSNTSVHIEDKGFVALGKSISKYRKLKDVSVDIRDCNDITQEGVQEFCQSFFNVYNLHKFILNGNLDNPPRELWKIASELDEKLPHRCLFVMQFRRCSSGTERFARGI